MEREKTDVRIRSFLILVHRMLFIKLVVLIVLWVPVKLTKAFSINSKINLWLFSCHTLIWSCTKPAKS